MRLTFKLIGALTCAIVVVLSINAAVRLRREVALFESDIWRDNRLLGRNLAAVVERIWVTVGEAKALDLVEAADARESHVAIRWYWADRPPAYLEPEQLAQLADRKEVMHQEAASGGAFAVLVPVNLPGGGHAIIELKESLAAKESYIDRTLFHAALATAALVLSCVLVAAILGVLMIGRPIRRLVAQARAIGEGDLRPRELARGRDELGQLAREMESMRAHLLAARERIDDETAQRMATLEQLRHADRLTTVGKLAAGIAHEVGTPLNVITGHAQLVPAFGDAEIHGEAERLGAAAVFDKPFDLRALCHTVSQLAG